MAAQDRELAGEPLRLGPPDLSNGPRGSGYPGWRFSWKTVEGEDMGGRVRKVIQEEPKEVVRGEGRGVGAREALRSHKKNPVGEADR